MFSGILAARLRDAVLGCTTRPLCVSLSPTFLFYRGFLVGRAAGIYFPLFPDLACVGGCREGMGKGGGAIEVGVTFLEQT